MSTRIGFRTRGGPTQGWGNIFRLASFARFCAKDADVRPVFFAEGPLEVERYLIDQGFDVVMFPEGLTAEEEQQRLAQEESVEVMIVEMLDITRERQRVLRAFAGRLVIFDDLCDHLYDAHLVVSGQDLPSHANRSLSAPETEFLVGYDYFLCRPEFVPFAERQRVHRARLEHVLVTLGGGAYGVGYLKAAVALAKQGLKGTFVLGFADHGDLPDRIREILPEAEILAGVSDIEERMWAADLVIGSAGYTKLEAALTQTPCLMMSVQWHQIPLAQAFHRRTGTPDLGYMSYVEPERVAEALLEMSSPLVREAYAKRAALAIDGKGFERVHAAVFGEAHS